MKVYKTENLRNVCLLGDKGVGKTTIAEAALFTAKLTTRLGKVDEGNTVVDYDQQEIDRKQTLTSKMLAFEWEGCKLNLLDTPGYADFIGESQAALWVADSACIVIDAGRHMTIGTKKYKDLVSALGKPCSFFINRLDSTRADWDTSLSQIKNATNNRA
ncbi:MAG TPA: GTP-binding protein, partial [bacterium]|nr:GTP-binding protein [bacterium]